MKQRMKHAIRRGTAVCLLVLCLAALWPGKAAAAYDPGQREKIRVGFFAMDGYQREEKFDFSRPIEITSEVNVGSTFLITIPFEIAPPPAAPVVPAAEEADIRGLRLLLAEDNALNAEIAETLLNDQSAQTTVVENGRKAVDPFQATPPGTFDAILMDIMMPEMDGIEATKAIRALDRPDAKTIPIIAMTANAFEEDAKKCLAAGMNAHLAKPLQIDLLAQTIVRYCRENA